MGREKKPRPLRISFQGDASVAARWRHWAETQARRKQRIWRDKARGSIKISAPDLATEAVQIELRRIFPGFDQLIIRGYKKGRALPFWMEGFYNDINTFDLENGQLPKTLITRPPDEYFSYQWTPYTKDKERGILRTDFYYDYDPSYIRIYDQYNNLKYVLNDGTSHKKVVGGLAIYKDKLYVVAASQDTPAKFGTWFPVWGAWSSLVQVYDLETGVFTGKEYDTMCIDADSLNVGRHGILVRGYRDDEPYNSSQLTQNPMMHAEFNDTHCRVLRDIGVYYGEISQSGDYIICFTSETISGGTEWNTDHDYVYVYKRNELTQEFEFYKKALTVFSEWPSPGFQGPEETTRHCVTDFYGGFYSMYHRTAPDDYYLIYEAKLRHYKLSFDDEGTPSWNYDPSSEYDLIQNMPSSVPHLDFTVFRRQPDWYPPTGPVPEDWEEQPENE